MKDGGPAFPYTNCEDHGICGAYGMSLRDWFAAKAMEALVSTYNPFAAVQRAPLAEDAYLIADAMLEERDKSAGT